MKLPITLSVLVLALVPFAARSDEIATWVDADGVTHFGNPQFAPDDARAVEVRPANGMVVPQTPHARPQQGGPSVVVLDKEPNRELVGWRGHQWNVSRRRTHRH